MPPPTPPPATGWALVCHTMHSCAVSMSSPVSTFNTCTVIMAIAPCKIGPCNPVQACSSASTMQHCADRILCNHMAVASVLFTSIVPPAHVPLRLEFQSCALYLVCMCFPPPRLGMLKQTHTHTVQHLFNREGVCLPGSQRLRIHSPRACRLNMRSVNACAGPLRRLQLKGLGGFAVAPAGEPRLAAYVAEAKGSPGFVGVWNHAALPAGGDPPAPLARRSFFRVRCALRGMLC